MLIPITSDNAGIHFGVLDAIDLNIKMGHMAIPLDEHMSNIIMLHVSFMSFKCIVLSQGISLAKDIYQERMSSFFKNLHFKVPKMHFNGIFHTRNSTFEEHSAVLDKILTKLEKAGMKVDTEKYSICVIELEFIGYLLTQIGCQPLIMNVCK